MEARLQGYGDPALESWVSSPPCTAPLEVATHQPPPAVRQEDPIAQVAGEVHPAAHSAAGSAGQPAISVPAAAGTHDAATDPAASPSAAQAAPIEHSQSGQGVPFLPSTPSSPPGGPLGPGNQPSWSAQSASLVRSIDGVPVP